MVFLAPFGTRVTSIGGSNTSTVVCSHMLCYTGCLLTSTVTLDLDSAQQILKNVSLAQQQTIYAQETCLLGEVVHLQPCLALQPGITKLPQYDSCCW